MNPCREGQDAWSRPRMCRSADDDLQVAAPGLLVLLAGLVTLWVVGRRQGWF